MMRIFVSFLLIFISSVSLGQGLVFRNYTTADGLNTNTVHNVFQDSRGYIWLSTDLGVTRFDGNEFKAYTESDGLVGGQIFGAAEDSLGNIWFHSFHRKLAYYSPTNDSFYQPSFNDTLASVATNFYFRIDFYRDKILLSGPNQGIIEVIQKSDHWIVRKLHESISGSVLKVYDEGVYAYNKINIHSDKKESFNNRITFKGIQDTAVSAIEEVNSGHCIRNIYYNHFRNSYVLTSNKRIVEIDSMFNVSSYSKSFLSTPGFSVSNEGDVWFGSTNSGLFEFKNGDFSIAPSRYLDELTVTSILFDNEHGMWVSTAEVGIFYSVNLKIRLVGSDLKSQLNNIKFLTTDDTLILLSKGFKRAEVFTKDHFPFAQDTIRFKQSIFNACVYQGKFFFREARNRKIMFMKDGRIDSINRFIQDFNSNGSDFIGTYADSVKLELYDSPQIESFGSISDQNVKAVKRVFSTTKGQAYLQLYQNSIVGLEIGENHSIRYDFVTPLPEVIEPVSILPLNEDSCILFTKKSGAFVIKGNKVQAQLMLFSDPEIILNDVFKHQESYFISTSKGVFKFENLRNNAELFINKYLGLPSDNVISMAYQAPYFVVACNDGIAYFKASDIEYDYDLPNVFLQVQLNGKPINSQELLSMDHDFGTLNIKASCISFVNAFSIRFRYRLNEDAAWSSMDGRSLTLSALQPGKYSIEFQAQGANGNYGEATLLNIQVYPPFWQNPVFFVLSSLVVLLMCLFLLKYRERRLRRQLMLKEELLKAQNQALSSQLKPHFIFNSMNSLVSFISTKDEKSSLRYLANLSKLMRSIFDSSESNLITIEKEMQAIEHYLELEKLRFNITYEIDCDQELSLYSIPPLLFQPLVENAVVHGVEKNQGKIRIRIRALSELIIGTVENSGNALNRDQFNDRKGSLAMIKRRLEILKSLKNLDIGLKVEPINEEGFVTRAQITFPKIKA